MKLDKRWGGGRVRLADLKEVADRFWGYYSDISGLTEAVQRQQVYGALEQLQREGKLRQADRDSVAGAFADGLGTGGKAVVNGLSSAAVSTVTLGEVTSVELIAVTDLDRAYGYDTAAMIAQASGEILIGVATGGAAGALAKGGRAARVAGAAIRANDMASNVAEVGRGVVDMAQNGVSLSNVLQVAGGGLGTLGNVSDVVNSRALRGAAGNVPASRVPDAPGGTRSTGGVCDVSNSFTPETHVLMADGSSKPISEIAPGDWVMAGDPETGEQVARQVTRLITGDGAKELVDIEVAGGSITATDGHPFWVESRRAWIEAEDLRAGDRVVNADGTESVVESVSAYRVSLQTVHNLTVADLHTYYVVSGDQNILVHNCSAGSTQAYREGYDQIDFSAPKGQKTYQTYTKTHPQTAEVYSGRTSGTGTPRQNVARRDSKHHMNQNGFGPAQLDKSSTTASPIRGREQQLITAHGGAKSQGGTSGNPINGISPQNPNRQQYLDDAVQEIGG